MKKMHCLSIFFNKAAAHCLMLCISFILDIDIFSAQPLKWTIRHPAKQLYNFLTFCTRLCVLSHRSLTACRLRGFEGGNTHFYVVIISALCVCFIGHLAAPVWTLWFLIAFWMGGLCSVILGLLVLLQIREPRGNSASPLLGTICGAVTLCRKTC